MASGAILCNNSRLFRRFGVDGAALAPGFVPRGGAEGLATGAVRGWGCGMGAFRLRRAVSLVGLPYFR